MTYTQINEDDFDDGEGLERLEKLYQHATSKVPASDRTLFVKAVLAQRNGRYKDAAEYAAQAVCMFPDGPQHQALLGEICAAAGWTHEAIVAYNRTIYIDPSDEHAWYDLGMLFARQNMAAQAETCFMQCIAIDPDMSEARTALVTLGAA